MRGFLLGVLIAGVLIFFIGGVALGDDSQFGYGLGSSWAAACGLYALRSPKVRDEA